jgi:signal transduction histidine kinase
LRKSAEIVFYIVLLYILVAGGWWSYLLHSKNWEAMEAKLENIELKLSAKGVEQIESHPEYREVADYFKRQRWMITGESAVFMFLLMLGMWRIFKINQKQMALANQQQNFLLSITHELKSPIASVQLVLETIQKRELTNAQLNKLSSNALVENQRLHKLVQDLLLAARVEGGYEYSFEPIEMQALVEECISWVGNRFEGEINFDHEDKEIILQKADYSTLSSAIFNLLDNAVKYAASSPSIEVKLYQKQNQCVLEIKDQGKGIPKADRQKIFNKFYRLGQENTRKTKGTGLGLYIVKKVVEAHHGQIQIKDNSPQGCIFQLTFPINGSAYSFRFPTNNKALN